MVLAAYLADYRRRPCFHQITTPAEPSISTMAATRPWLLDQWADCRNTAGTTSAVTEGLWVRILLRSQLCSYRIACLVGKGVLPRSSGPCGSLGPGLAPRVADRLRLCDLADRALLPS